MSLIARQARPAAVAFVLAAVVLASAFFGPAASPSTHAQTAEPFLQPGPVVVVSDRLVCSLLGEQKLAVGITGQDTGDTAVIGDTVYWTFGDTVVESGQIPNIVGTSTDADASDCVDIFPKQSGGEPVPLLPATLNELTVWPIALEATGPSEVHFFYSSIVGEGPGNWSVQGTGIGSFDTNTLTARRALVGMLPWGPDVPRPARAFGDETYVYIVLTTTREPWTTDALLARVPKDSVESLSSYEYWQPGEPGAWVGGQWIPGLNIWANGLDFDPLWRQVTGHNGVDIAYNDFLGKWLAVYSTGFLSSVNVRAADDLTGPWDGPESKLVECADFHPAAATGWLCYSGAQHAYFAADGGRTIYVSYSNEAAYQPYLHEIRLASPVTQWSNGQGDAVYIAGDAPGPGGASADGVAFYASDIAANGLAPIHRWQEKATGTVFYGATQPPGEFTDLGADFYAAADEAAAEATNALYEPVYRWTQGGLQRYSPLDLAPAGFTRHEIAFYAACPDTDGDTLTDCRESALGTDAANADTDGDLLSDGYETTTAGCDPLVFNGDDLDGLSWIDEVFGGTTSPCLWDSGAIGCLYGEFQPPSCDIDTDGDGCRDAWEEGPNPALGGQRDPEDFWDFYDTPAPNGRDEFIDFFNDTFAIVTRFGANDAGGTAAVTRNTDPMSTAPAAPDYHPAFDRSFPQPGDEPWQAGPADGSIDLFNDIFAIVYQYGHTCTPDQI